MQPAAAGCGLQKMTPGDFLSGRHAINMLQSIGHKISGCGFQLFQKNTEPAAAQRSINDALFFIERIFKIKQKIHLTNGQADDIKTYSFVLFILIDRRFSR